MGAPLTVDGLAVTVDPRGWDGRLAARDLVVPGDLSSAAFLLGAAAVVPGSRVVVRGVGVNPTRTGVIDALRAMGARIELSDERIVGGEPVADLACTGGALRGIRIDGELAVRAIDELPLLAAVAAHAEGETRIADAAELRVKESDRIAATAAMLRALGVEVEEHPDGLTVRGGRGVRAGVVESHGDHRIAMAGAVCALGAAGETLIRDTKNVATSFPTFAQRSLRRARRRNPLLSALSGALRREPRDGRRRRCIGARRRARLHVTFHRPPRHCWCGSRRHAPRAPLGAERAGRRIAAVVEQLGVARQLAGVVDGGGPAAMLHDRRDRRRRHGARAPARRDGASRRPARARPRRRAADRCDARRASSRRGAP